jgi:hypothetical protein
VDHATVAELAALLATAIATVAVYPQLRRVLVDGDGCGVSVTSAVLGIATEVAWIAYSAAAGLWSAVPEAVIMAAANALLAVTLLRRTPVAGRAVVVGMAWFAVLGAVAVLGGLTALAVVLAGAYAVQVTPALWTVWRTPSPTGVAAATWALVGVEGVLWGAYGIHHGDPATTSLGAVCIGAAAAALARKAVVRHPVTSPGTTPART